MSLNSINDLVKIAQQKGQKKNRLAIVMAEENHVIQAIKKAYEMGLIAPFLIGDINKIKNTLDQESLILPADKIIHAESDIQAVKIAIQLIAENKADMIMKGMISTKTLLHEVIKKESDTRQKKLLSHFAIFESPFYHKPFGLTDAAMNIAPDVDEKISIINNAVEAFRKLGCSNPKVAILAAVETVNNKIQATVDADIIHKKYKDGLFTECIIDGPLALDLAISKEAASIKNISSLVAGDADILIAPDLNAGNILYKSLSYLGNAKLAGVILGAFCPIILTSRADTEDNKLLSIALAISLC
jgi:phosphate butyryltransferase